MLETHCHKPTNCIGWLKSHPTKIEFGDGSSVGLPHWLSLVVRTNHKVGFILGLSRRLLNRNKNNHYVSGYLCPIISIYGFEVAINQRITGLDHQGAPDKPINEEGTVTQICSVVLHYIMMQYVSLDLIVCIYYLCPVQLDHFFSWWSPMYTFHVEATKPPNHPKWGPQTIAKLIYNWFQ